jgi:hypothetical protein
MEKVLRHALLATQVQTKQIPLFHSIATLPPATAPLAGSGARACRRWNVLSAVEDLLEGDGDAEVQMAAMVVQ